MAERTGYEAALDHFQQTRVDPSTYGRASVGDEKLGLHLESTGVPHVGKLALALMVFTGGDEQTRALPWVGGLGGDTNFTNSTLSHTTVLNDFRKHNAHFGLQPGGAVRHSFELYRPNSVWAGYIVPGDESLGSCTFLVKDKCAVDATEGSMDAVYSLTRLLPEMDIVYGTDQDDWLRISDGEETDARVYDPYSGLYVAPPYEVVARAQEDGTVGRYVERYGLDERQEFLLRVLIVRNRNQDIPQSFSSICEEILNGDHD